MSKSKTTTLWDDAVENASKNAPPSQREAFEAYEAMAKYLDDNFPPVKAEPQTAPLPVMQPTIHWRIS